MSQTVPTLQPMETAVEREARLGALCGWISAIAWIAIGVDSIVRPVQDNRRELYWCIPFAFMMLEIVAVHRVQRGRGLRLERNTYYLVLFASALASPGRAALCGGVADAVNHQPTSFVSRFCFRL